MTRWMLAHHQSWGVSRLHIHVCASANTNRRGGTMTEKEALTIVLTQPFVHLYACVRYQLPESFRIRVGNGMRRSAHMKFLGGARCAEGRRRIEEMGHSVTLDGTRYMWLFGAVRQTYVPTWRMIYLIRTRIHRKHTHIHTHSYTYRTTCFFILFLPSHAFQMRSDEVSAIWIQHTDKKRSQVCMRTYVCWFFPCGLCIIWCLYCFCLNI